VFWSEWNACINHAVAKAVDTVHNERLSAYHWERSRGWKLRSVATLDECREALIVMPVLQQMRFSRQLAPAYSTADRFYFPNAGSTEDAFELSRSTPDTHMVATPMSKRVHTPKNTMSSS